VKVLPLGLLGRIVRLLFSVTTVLKIGVEIDRGDDVRAGAPAVMALAKVGKATFAVEVEDGEAPALALMRMGPDPSAFTPPMLS